MSQGRQILIVEDEPDLRDMMSQLLRLEGFRPIAVGNGREALSHLQQSEKPDVILLDLMMPVMDGWQFRSCQQQDENLRSIPVIVLTAVDQRRAAAIDAFAFLTKPLDFDRLVELIRRAPTV